MEKRNISINIQGVKATKVGELLGKEEERQVCIAIFQSWLLTIYRLLPTHRRAEIRVVRKKAGGKESEGVSVGCLGCPGGESHLYNRNQNVCGSAGTYILTDLLTHLHALIHSVIHLSKNII